MGFTSLTSAADQEDHGGQNEEKDNPGGAGQRLNALEGAVAGGERHGNREQQQGGSGIHDVRDEKVVE